MKLTFNALPFREEPKRGEVILTLSPQQWKEWATLKYGLKADYVAVELKAPHKPRTTGEKSQNHRVNGFIQQIAMATGDDFDELKVKLKQKAISRGWPFYTVEEEIGGVLHEFRIARSESDASTRECSALIEAIQQYAAESGIVLRES